MMDSKELIRAGKLSDARTQLIEEVKSSPANAGKRTLLFQIHSLLGEWDKAERHLDVLAAQEASRETGVQVYKNLVQAERRRLEVFRDGRSPSFLPETPHYFEMYKLASEKLRGGNIDEAVNLFDSVNELIPVISGSIDGKDFTGFSDTDIFLLFFLEAIAHEQYLWIPFEAIREISITPPKTLFDLIWIPARITTWSGLSLNCQLPVIYPESFLHQDDRIKLGRMTQWSPIGGPFSKGMGQHVYIVGDDEISILDIREITFNVPHAGERDEKTD
ncbi:MAG: type VI secretion system accessory protein TagJ [Syntrophaceae bacterium]